MFIDGLELDIRCAGRYRCMSDISKNISWEVADDAAGLLPSSQSVYACVSNS